MTVEYRPHRRSSLRIQYDSICLQLLRPFIDFDVQTNPVILHAEQNFYDKVYTQLSNKNAVQIYLNERLYDLFVGVPYQFVSNTGEMNYRLQVIYNNSNLISKTVLVPSVPTATTKKSIMYRWL
ncbi:MAG: hypothetical protein ACKPKO_04460, partial [Candidatus Fonsibacter sp.]